MGRAVLAARPGVGVVAVQARSRRGLGISLLAGLGASGRSPSTPVCGHIVGDGFSVQSNMLAGDDVLPAMAEAGRRRG